MNMLTSIKPCKLIPRTIFTEILKTIEQEKLQNEIGWNIQIIGENCCGKTSLLSFIYSNEIVNALYPTRLLWYSIGKIETMHELLILIDMIGSDISRELHHGENIYHPDCIDDWIFYLKDYCNMKEWLFCLDDVCDQLFVDLLLSTGASVIQTSHMLPLAQTSKTFTFHLQDFSSEEISQYLNSCRTEHPFLLTPTFYKLLNDISACPLDLAILLSLIGISYQRNGVHSDDDFDYTSDG